MLWTIHSSFQVSDTNGKKECWVLFNPYVPVKDEQGNLLYGKFHSLVMNKADSMRIISPMDLVEKVSVM